MDIPGLSIFQGGGSIHLDVSLNRAEEEEALEDQRRRNEELGNQLQDAFDDLIEDDEYTVNASVDLQSQYKPNLPPVECNREEENGHAQFHYNNLISKSSETRQEDHKECRCEIDKLKKCLESKTREVENLTKLIHDERKKVQDIKKQLTLSEAEKERVQMATTQTHELLVESKTKISDMEAEMDKFRSVTKDLESKNKEVVAELERTKLQLADAQHKYRMVERNASVSADIRSENLIKDANERHAAQIIIMQQQIDNLRDKLDTKERDYSSLDVRYRELQKNREALLIEKSDAINKLARSLEDSQRHCQELICNKGASQENKRLQGVVGQLEQQVESMQRTINDLTTQLDATVAELNLMEEVLGEQNTTSEITRRRSNTRSERLANSPSVVNDKILRLKDELYRSVTAQKEKREEIRRLQDQLTKQSEEIRRLKADENNALIQITTIKEANLKLTNKLRLMETELSQLRDDNRQEGMLTDDLRQRIEKMKTECGHLSDELTNARRDCEITKKKNEELQLEIDSLLVRLKSKEEADKVIEVLKEKARKLQEYIHSESRTTKIPTKYHDRSVSTSPELDPTHALANERHKIESDIRSDMAKAFAVKIKSVEATFDEKFRDIEKHNSQLKQDMHSMYIQLQTREKEVDLLKHAILKEREKMSELLDSKSVQIHEMNSILENCRQELKAKQQHIEQLQQELRKRGEQFEVERNAMKSIMSQWADQQKSCDRIRAEMEMRLEKTEANYGKRLDILQAKYDSAKKTAANYKKYAEDKENHMLKEYERIKIGYETALKKSEEQIRCTLDEERKQMMQKIAQIEAKYIEQNSKLELRIPSL